MSDKRTTGNIKFIEYTGKAPSLCGGTLTLEIDGQEVKFGWEHEYPPFWYSGGWIVLEDDEVYQKPWEIDPLMLPEYLRSRAQEIKEIFNSNVPWGCCGGCI